MPYLEGIIQKLLGIKHKYDTQGACLKDYPVASDGQMIKYLKYVNNTTNYCPDVTFQVFSRQCKTLKRYYTSAPFLTKRKSCPYFPKVSPNRTFGEYILKTLYQWTCLWLLSAQKSVSHLGHPKTAHSLDCFNKHRGKWQTPHRILRTMQPLVSLPTDPPWASPQLLFAFMPHCLWIGIWTPSLLCTVKAGTGLSGAERDLSSRRCKPFGRQQESCLDSPGF